VTRVKTWEEFYPSPRTLHDMLRWVNTHSELVTKLAAHERILEVGTGTGILSGFLARFCEEVITIDNSAGVLRNACGFMTEVGARVLAVRGDAFRLPFVDGSIGACFSQGLLEHFSDDEIVLLIAEQLRVAEIAYVSIPSLFYPHLGRRGPGLVGNERLMRLGRWRRLLSGRWHVEGRYYPDFKVATIAGVTLPLPTQILLQVSHRERGG